MRPRGLFIQLARLGDLVQSFPAFSSLTQNFSGTSFDLLCPGPLVPLARLFPDVHEVYTWNGPDWHDLACSNRHCVTEQLKAVRHYLEAYAFPSYAVAYNLNNHPRGILLSHLLGHRVVGPGDQGPLNPMLPGWAKYLKGVAEERGLNRIHLADAFCGLCGVKPPSRVPRLKPFTQSLADDQATALQNFPGRRIALVLGAGDSDRRVPVGVWKRLIESSLQSFPDTHVVLIGGAGEREISLILENQLSPSCLSRVFNSCGRTTIPQLTALLGSCQWVIGSDTGPLHLGVLAGARAIGWYFSRARVHETGPYGEGHFVWQYQSEASSLSKGRMNTVNPRLPGHWPVRETIQLIGEGECIPESIEWTLWTGQRDEWGVYYHSRKDSGEGRSRRKKVWENICSSSIPTACGVGMAQV